MKTIPPAIVLIASVLAGSPQTSRAAYTKDRLSPNPVFAGNFQSFALENGRVWGWGDNRFLGIGPPSGGTPQLTPAPAAGLDGVAAIAAGSTHTLARRTNGTVWAWGFNISGQLGNGTHDSANVPVQVPGLSNIVAVAAGAGHSLALDSAGRVWAWGMNAYGQLGITNFGEATQPVQTPALSNITAICAGYTHSLAMDASGAIWAWGANGYGQLGLGTYETGRTNSANISGLTGVKQLAAGREHTLALNTNGQVWAWGRDMYGQLGEGESWADRATPVAVLALSNIVSISAGFEHSMALASNGTIWAWGRNQKGQLGDGLLNNRFTPFLVSRAEGEMAAISAGYEHSLAVDRHGQLFGWGINSSGQLGNGRFEANYPVGPVKAIHQFRYRILVVMLSRYDVGTNYSSIVADMDRLVADIGRYSYGKVALSYDLTGPYLADPIADIGCNGAVEDNARMRDYAIAAAIAHGIDIGSYAHVIIEVEGNLRPTCGVNQNGGTYSGGMLTNTGVTILLPGAFSHSEYNRHIVAHEFLHGYGNCGVVPHNAVLDCGCNAAYQPKTGGVFFNPFCSARDLNSAMDIMALPAAANNTETGADVNGIYKEAFGWLSGPDIVMVTNSGSYDLYPLDDPGLTNGRVYLLKLPVLGLALQDAPQQFSLEYRKQALIGRSPGPRVWPGVYPFLSERGCEVPNAFLLRTQPANPNTDDGITPLSITMPTMLDPAGLVVQVTSLNESFARVYIDFNGTIRPTLRNFVRSGVGCSFEICGIRTGAMVTVERSWSLPSMLWETVTTFVSDGHSKHWSDSLNNNKSTAYYRVRVQ